jgi:hypothetical protein
MQHCAIAGAKACPGIRGVEQSLDLCPVEVVDQRLVGLLGRDRSDAKGLIQAGRNTILDVAEEGPDRGEPAIAGPNTAAATVLDMVKEGHDHVGAEILDLEIGRPTLQPIGSELDQEDEAVGIGLHRVRTDSTFARQMFTQVAERCGASAVMPLLPGKVARWRQRSRSSTGVASRYQYVLATDACPR